METQWWILVLFGLVCAFLMLIYLYFGSQFGHIIALLIKPTIKTKLQKKHNSTLMMAHPA